MRRLVLFALLAAVLMPCSVRAGQRQVAPLCITDDTGTRVCLDAPARRIAPLYAAISEILDSLGQCRNIVVRTKGDDLACLRDVPAAGTHLRPNLELILGLRPDLAVQMTGREKAMLPVAQLRERNIPTAVFQVRDFDDLFRVITALGLLTGSQEKADKLITSIRKRLLSVEQRVRNLPRPSVFYEVRYPNLLGAGRHSMVNTIIEQAGGRNVLSQNSKFVRLNEEVLLATNPDAYLVQQGPMNPDPTPPAQRDHFASLSCVARKRVLIVAEQLFSRPSPRSVDAVEQLACFLHPETCLPSQTTSFGESHDK